MNGFREMSREELHKTNGGNIVRVVVQIIKLANKVIKQQPPPMLPLPLPRR